MSDLWHEIKPYIIAEGIAFREPLTPKDDHVVGPGPPRLKAFFFNRHGRDCTRVGPESNCNACQVCRTQGCGLNDGRLTGSKKSLGLSG